MSERILDRAIVFAVDAHAGVTRRDGHTPYILHCTETAAITATMTEDPEVLAAAVLHDTLEDTAVTREQLTDTFGPRITELVVELSENKRSDLPPEDTAVRMIFLGDKLSNLRGIYRDYLQYGDDLWEMFHQKSRAKQGWYYMRLEQALNSLSHTTAFAEFHRLRQAVFEG